MTEKKFMENGYDYYNIEKQTNNKQKQISNELLSVPIGRTSSLAYEHQEPFDSKSQKEEGEPLDSGAEAEEAPLGPHNVKRAVIQLFCNDDGSRKLKVRVNLSDGESADFIAPLQPRSNLSSYLRHTGVYKESAREWFTGIRKHAKARFGHKPQQGKFHEVANSYGARRQTIQVEPLCYGSVVYNKEDREYVAYVKLYDLILSEIDLFSDYVTDKQKRTGVRGQYLWINPRFDDRRRPMTWAEKRKKQLTHKH